MEHFLIGRNREKVLEIPALVVNVQIQQRVQFFNVGQAPVMIARQRHAAAGRVRVLGALPGIGFLLPHQPRRFVRYRAVPVVMEAACVRLAETPVISAAHSQHISLRVRFFRHAASESRKQNP